MQSLESAIQNDDFTTMKTLNEDLQKQLMEISQQATQSSAPDSAAGGEEVIETDFSTEK